MTAQIFSAWRFVLGNIINGPKTVTVNLSPASGGSLGLIVDEYSGAQAAADPRDGHAGQLQASATAATSGNFTTTVSGNLIYGASCNTNNATMPSAGSGFTARQSQASGAALYTEDMVQSAAGATARRERRSLREL
jgi:hypothetical protein